MDFWKNLVEHVSFEGESWYLEKILDKQDEYFLLNLIYAKGTPIFHNHTGGRFHTLLQYPTHFTFETLDGKWSVREARVELDTLKVRVLLNNGSWVMFGVEDFAVDNFNIMVIEEIEFYEEDWEQSRQDFDQHYAECIRKAASTKEGA